MAPPVLQEVFHFRSTNFLRMERESTCKPDRHKKVSTASEVSQSQMYHQKAMDIELEKRSKSMSISSVYSMGGKNDWETFQEKTKEFQKRKLYEDQNNSESLDQHKRHFSSSNTHSNNSVPARRMFIKRPGSLVTGKFKRHSLQPVRLLSNVSNSRPQSILEDEVPQVSDPFRATSSTLLSPYTAASATRRHKDSFETTTNSECDDSLDDLTSIPSILSVNESGLASRDPNLRSFSIDSAAMGLKKTNRQRTAKKLNIHQFPNSHSFYTHDEMQNQSSRKNTANLSSCDVSSISNGDHILSNASSNSSLASQFLNQDTILKDVNNIDYANANAVPTILDQSPIFKRLSPHKLPEKPAPYANMFNGGAVSSRKNSPTDFGPGISTTPRLMIDKSSATNGTELNSPEITVAQRRNYFGGREFAFASNI